MNPSKGLWRCLSVKADPDVAYVDRMCPETPFDPRCALRCCRGALNGFCSGTDDIHHHVRVGEHGNVAAGNGQTKLTFIGNEPMESAKNSGQMEGWNEILDKLAAVVTKLAQAK